MKKELLLVLLIISSFFLCVKGNGLPSSKDKPEYAVSNISEELLNKAIAVVREDIVSLEIESKQKSYHKGLVATTILTPQADYLCYNYLYYGKFRQIKNFTGALYDKNGTLIQKIKKSDISDESATSYGTLFSDSRVQYAGFKSQDYPFTVEFEYEIEMDGSLYYPSNTFQSSADISVEKSTFEVITPKDYEIRIKECNLSNAAQVSLIEEKSHYSWEEKNLPVYEREPFSPPYYEVMPMVFIAPTDFIMEGYEGNMETWEGFGSWLFQLNEGRQVLPEETVTLIKKLVENCKTPTEKIETIYNYLQTNTRYISIQVGIGGWQPFEASLVDKYKYGDCKALVNYTKALLNIVDINSFYTLVKAGADTSPIMDDFPSNQFNHVILCVPVENDTLWLECTSQTIPFGYLGDFTDDREVLLVTPEGGKITHTTTYTGKTNQLQRKGNVEIYESGDATADINTVYKGIQYETIGNIIDRDFGSQKKALYNRIDIPSFEIKSFSLQVEKKQIPTGEENFNLQLSKYATISGKRIFFIPNVLNRNSYIPKKLEKREHDIMVKMAYEDCDSIFFKIPEGYEIEYLPEDISIRNEFGRYSIELKVINNEILYIRNHTMNHGRYPKESYTAFREFLKEISGYDKKKVILSKET